MLKRIVSDEKGGVLAWALVALALGALLIPPLLSRVSANLITSRVIEEGLKEQYAADSGVEYALLRIQNGITASQRPYTYTINNKSVEVTWGEYITETYRITSTATSQVYGGSTKIESYITLFMYDYLWLLDNAITSLGDVSTAPGTYVSGTVQYGGERPDFKGTIYPEEPEGPTDDLDDKWPPAEDMAEFFFADVEGLTPYPYDSIDVKDTHTIGPLYREGDLSVDNSGDPATLTLEGTIYVIGDLDFEQGGNKAYTIDLNGQTIYVARDEEIEDTGDVYFASKCTIIGSGCIIADGFVNFQPGVDSGPDDFVFVMSVTDYVWMKPNGDFYGSVAGDTYVDLQPGCSLIWTDWAGRDLNFPDGTTGRAQIHTYKVYPGAE